MSLKLLPSSQLSSKKLCMKPWLLSQRKFMREGKPDVDRPPQCPFSFRFLILEGLAFYHYPFRPADKEDGMLVEVVMRQRDRVRNVADPATTNPAADEVTDLERRCFSFKVPYDHVDRAVWQTKVVEMSMYFNLHPDSYQLLTENLVSFLIDTAAQAREKEFVSIFVAAVVEELVMQNQSPDTEFPYSEMTVGSGEGEESRFLRAAMARGAIRAVKPKAGDTCTICLDDFSDGTQISKLSCSHVFHSDCIIRWLKQRLGVQQCCQCSMCRYEVKLCQSFPIIFSERK